MSPERIVDAVRFHCGYTRPEVFEVWRWFTPRDDEWPNDATEEEERLAHERQRREIEVLKTSNSK